MKYRELMLTMAVLLAGSAVAFRASLAHAETGYRGEKMSHPPVTFLRASGAAAMTLSKSIGSNIVPE